MNAAGIDYGLLRQEAALKRVGAEEAVLFAKQGLAAVADGALCGIPARKQLDLSGHALFFLEARAVAGDAHEDGSRAVPSSLPCTSLKLVLPFLASCRAVELAKNRPR